MAAAKKQTKPKEFNIEFTKDFKGNINNYPIDAKAGEKWKVNKMLFEFCKKHGVIK